MKWLIQNASDDYTRYQIEQKGFGIVARVENIGNTPMEDARLMAAAPELLAAIQELLVCPDLNLDELEEDTIASIKKARLAIAKATGA